MEIRHQRVDDPEMESGGDEKPCIAGVCIETACRGRRLERTHGGGPDRYHAAATFPACTHGIAHFRRDIGAFRMHAMLADVVHPDRLERAGADVQRDVRAGEPGIPARGQQDFVEVQACSRRGHRARRARIDSLVALTVEVLRGTLHVRRQRNLAAAFKNRTRSLGEIEHPELVLTTRDGRGRAAGKPDRRPHGGRLARAQLHQRAASVEHPLEHQLDAAARFLRAEQSGRHDARVVEHQQVATAQQLRQVGELPVGDGAAGSVQVQKPAVPASRGRMPRDQVVGQFVVEFGAQHGARMLAEGLRAGPWTAARSISRAARAAARWPRSWIASRCHR